MNVLRSNSPWPVQSTGASAAPAHPGRRPRMVIAANTAPRAGQPRLNLQHMAVSMRRLRVFGVLPGADRHRSDVRGRSSALEPKP